jgi:hypothetical protein
MRFKIISSLNWPNSHFTFCMSAQFLQLRPQGGLHMNEKDPGERTSTEEFGLPKDKERANIIRVKLVPVFQHRSGTPTRTALIP